MILLLKIKSKDCLKLSYKQKKQKLANQKRDFEQNPVINSQNTKSGIRGPGM
jgi:hypothetical protein